MPKKTDTPKKSLDELRAEASKQSMKTLQKLYVGKGRLIGNYYLVCDSSGRKAGLVITLQAKDKKGNDATARGRKLRKGGLRYSKGTVVYRKKGSKILFRKVSGNASKALIKTVFKKVLIGEYKLNILKKVILQERKKADKTRPDATGDAGYTDGERVDISTDTQVGAQDLQMSEEDVKTLKTRMQQDPDLQALFQSGSPLQKSLAEANDTLEKTYFNATIELAVDMADHWWGDDSQSGWRPPPLQYPSQESFIKRARSPRRKKHFLKNTRYTKEKYEHMLQDMHKHPTFYKEHYGFNTIEGLRAHWEQRQTDTQLEALWNKETSDASLRAQWAAQNPGAVPSTRPNRFLRLKTEELAQSIQTMKPLLKQLNQERTTELIDRIEALKSKQGGRTNDALETLLEDAEIRQKTFQRVLKIKETMSTGVMSYDQASEYYLTQLYVDAARAQMRLKHLTTTHFPESDQYEVHVPGAHQIKGMERARVKAEENEEGTDSNFSTLGDLARGSIYFKQIKDIVPGMRRFIQALPAESIIPKFKNRFAPGNHYRDIIITITLDNNHVTEMQFHSQHIADIKSEGSTVTDVGQQQTLQKAVRDIRKLVKTNTQLEVPLDTRDILTQIEAGKNWKLSGHDFYNITRWIENTFGTPHPIIQAVSSVANKMYDDAFDAATHGIDPAVLNELQTLNLATVNGWRKPTKP